MDTVEQTPQPEVPTRSRVALRVSLVVLVIVACVGPLVGLELHYRTSGTFLTYCERTGLGYCPPSEKNRIVGPWIFAFNSNDDFPLSTHEFTTEIVTNSAGIPSREFPLAKSAGEFRVLFLGDSFTTGVGAPHGHGFVDEVERRLHVSVVNAGIPGSDPVYYVEFLRHRLAELYHPDLVVMAVNSSDVDDVIRRGGFERFDSRGALVENVPWFAGLFQRSHLARAIFMQVFGYDWNLTSPAVSQERRARAARILVEAGVTLERLAVAGGFKALVLFHPYPHELHSEDYPDPLPLVRAGLRQAGVSLVDIREELHQRLGALPDADYSWPVDGHYNEAGYRVFGEAVAGELVRGRVVPAGLASSQRVR